MEPQIINWLKVTQVTVFFVPASLLGTSIMILLKFRSRVKEKPIYLWIDIFISICISLAITIGYVIKFDSVENVFFYAFGSALGGTPIARKIRQYSIKQVDNLPDKFTNDEHL